MFDSVGKSLDEDAAKRSAQSVAIATVLAGLGAASVVCAGLLTVKEVVLDPILDEEIFEIAMEDQGIDPEAAPPPPPPPPPPPAAAVEPEEEEEEEEVEETPDEMVEEVKELEEKIDQDIKSAERPAGVEGGVEGGEEGGVVGGVIGGVKDGVVGGELGAGGPRVLHHSQVEVKRRVDPRYPAAARGLGLGEQRCKVTVYIDEAGIPYRTSIEGCPKVFHPETEEAILKWRWYPFKEGGQKLKVQVTIIVKYREV